MSLYSQFGTNKEAEVKGVWVEYGANRDGKVPSFQIARMAKSNKKYTKALEKATRPHRRAIELETMDENLAESIFLEVFVDTVLIGWKNVLGKDGKVLKFSKENAINLFTDLPELYDDLQEKSKKATLFREVELDADAGN